MRTNRVIAIVAVAWVLAYWPPAAAACVCMMSPFNCAEIGRSDAVLEATVESIGRGTMSDGAVFLRERHR